MLSMIEQIFSASFSLLAKNSPVTPESHSTVHFKSVHGCSLESQSCDLDHIEISAYLAIRDTSARRVFVHHALSAYPPQKEIWPQYQ
jgi:hypothetical protein